VFESRHKWSNIDSFRSPVTDKTMLRPGGDFHVLKPFNDENQKTKLKIFGLSK